MKVMANTHGYNAMMSAGHHLSCAHSSILNLSADVVRVASAFCVIISNSIINTIIKIKRKMLFIIQEYTYASI